MKENKTAAINARIKPSKKKAFKDLCKILKVSQSELIETMIEEKKREVTYDK